MRVNFQYRQKYLKNVVFLSFLPYQNFYEISQLYQFLPLNNNHPRQQKRSKLIITNALLATFLQHAVFFPTDQPTKPDFLNFNVRTMGINYTRRFVL